MTYTLTQQLSHEELWESWDPTRREDEITAAFQSELLKALNLI